MSEQNSFEGQGKEVPWQEQIQEINDIMHQGKFNGMELRLAYQMSLGLSEGETSYPDKITGKIRDLSVRLTDMSKNGLPLTAIVGILKEVEEKESSVDVYSELVSSLAISEKEKAVLYSIVQNKRSGVLIISDAKTLREFAKIKIPEFSKDDYPAYQVAKELTAALYLFKDGAKIEISFME